MTEQPVPTEFQQLAVVAAHVVMQDNNVKITAFLKQRAANADNASKGTPLPYPGLMPPLLQKLDVDKFVAIFAADNEAAKDENAKADHFYDNLVEAYSLFMYAPALPPVVVKPTQPANPLGAPMDEDGNQFGSAPGDNLPNGSLYTTADGATYKKTSRVAWGGVRVKYWTLQA